MAKPELLRIPWEGPDSDRFSHLGRYRDGQFFAYVIYGRPKSKWSEENSSQGEIVWRQSTNLHAVLHCFDHQGHIDTTTSRVAQVDSQGLFDPALLDELVAKLPEATYSDIYVRPFSVTNIGTTIGLFYECGPQQDNGEVEEWVMLEPHDVMFHPPWESGDYST